MRKKNFNVSCTWYKSLSIRYLILIINTSLSSYFQGLRIVDTCGNIQFTSSRILSLAAEYNLINFIANKNDVGNYTVTSKRVSKNLSKNFDGKITTLFCGYSTLPDYSRDLMTPVTPITYFRAYLETVLKAIILSTYIAF